MDKTELEKENQKLRKQVDKLEVELVMVKKGITITEYIQSLPSYARTDFLREQLWECKGEKEMEVLVEQTKQILGNLAGKIQGMGQEFDPENEVDIAESAKDEVVAAAKGERKLEVLDGGKK